MAREKFGFVFIDCPSDHEIDGILTTECDTLKALISNRNLGSRLKNPIKISTVESFRNIKESYKYSPQYVHLAGHGSKDGLGLIGGLIEWEEVGRKLSNIMKELKKNEKRVLCLSCCHSQDGFNSIKKELSNHFTGCYLFHRKTISFSTSLTVWSMFYLRKKLNKPHQKIVESINTFFDEKVIMFKTFS